MLCADVHCILCTCVALGFFHTASRVAVRNRTGVFTLGDRACVLTTELEDPAVIPHSAQKVDKRVGHRESLQSHLPIFFLERCFVAVILFCCDLLPV